MSGNAIKWLHALSFLRDFSQTDSLIPPQKFGPIELRSEGFQAQRMDKKGLRYSGLSLCSRPINIEELYTAGAQ